MARILVGLSGGVDSAAAAALLIEQGHEVVGGYMKNWINEDGLPGDCPWESDLDDAYAVAKKLGIELRVVDLIDQYRERIVDYLLEGYRSGVTPNPDVMTRSLSRWRRGTMCVEGCGRMARQIYCVGRIQIKISRIFWR